MTRKITGIIIHCSATPNGRWHNVGEIDEWHQDRGFHRADQFRKRQNPQLLAIGYHFIIYPNGALATGRHLDEVGAHAKGFNLKSIGICLLGTNQFTVEQWATLRGNVLAIQKNYLRNPQVRVVGHRNLPNVKKTCPGFDVSTWLEGGMQPLTDHLLEDKT